MKLFFVASCLFSVRAFAADVDTTPPSNPEGLEIVSIYDDQINLKWFGSGDDGWEGKAARYLAKASATAILDEDQWQVAPDLQLEFTTKPNSRRVTAYTVGTRLGDRGFITIRAQDDAGNLSELTPGLAFNIANPYKDFSSVLTKKQDDAAVMGNEADGRQLFGCVTQIEKDVVPGKIGLYQDTCTIAHGTAEIGVPIFRLIAKSNGYRWQDSAAAMNPVKTGRINGEDASTCRAPIEKGLHIGFFVKSLGCNISYGGGVRIPSKFELLVK